MRKAFTAIALTFLFVTFGFSRIALADSVTFTAQVGDTIAVLSGYTSPNSLVTFIENNNVIGTTTSTNSGSFSKTFTAQNPGEHNFVIYSTDQNNQMTPSINKSIILIGLMTTEINDLILAPTINVNVNYTSGGGTVIVKGYAIPSSHLIVTINSSTQKISALNADTLGYYEYNLDISVLEPGTHTVSVDLVDNNNATLAQSFELTFNVNNTNNGGGEPVSSPNEPTPVPQPTPTPTPQPTPTPVQNPPAIPVGTQILNEVKQVATEVLPTALITTSVGVFAVNLISTPSSITIFYGLFVFKFRKKKISRGIIFDSKVKNPIPFTVVRLFDESGKYLKQTVSDLNGKFSFIADKGKYSIEAKQTGYITYRKSVELEQDEGNIADNVPLVTNDSIQITFKDRLRTIVRDNLILLNSVLVIVGFILSLAALAASVNWLNIIIVLLYSFQFIVLIVSRRVNRSWGYIYNKISNERIKGGFVRILDLKEKRQIDVQISDEKGRFGFDLDPGEYYLSVDVPGFTLEKRDDIITTESGAQLLKFKIIKKNYTDIKLPMIPSDKPSTSTFGM